MKPEAGSYALRTMPCSPAASGIIASSSAYVSAPNSESNPAATQTESAIIGVPVLQVITRALIKTPVPIMLATLTEIAAVRPRPRTSWAFLFTNDLGTVRKRHKTEHKTHKKGSCQLKPAPGKRAKRTA